MRFNLSITDSDADILIRALANLRADALIDRDTFAIKARKAEAIYQAIDEYDDNSEAYVAAHLLALQAAEKAEVTRTQRANLAIAAGSLISLIEEEWGVEK